MLGPSTKVFDPPNYFPGPRIDGRHLLAAAIDSEYSLRLGIEEDSLPDPASPPAPCR